MAQCGVCGRAYDEQRFQIVLRRPLESFDTVECAHRARRPPRPGVLVPSNAEGETTLARLERVTAELFATRSRLDEELQRSARLERENARLASELAREGVAR